MINKKGLIELFENRLEHSNFEIKHIDNVGYPCITFSSELYDSNGWKTHKINENGYIPKSTSGYGDCEMSIFFKNDTYYISFNTIKTKITFSEFKRLKNMFENIKGQKSNVFKKLEEKRDEKLLNLVFSNKAKKEKRNILVEKAEIGVMYTKEYEGESKSLNYNVN